MSNIVWTNGCFDILHLGHIRLLERCYAEACKVGGSQVVVGVDSDARVRTMKGSGRPFNKQYDRAEMVRNVRAVSRTIIFDTDDELRGIIKALQPRVLIVGEEYRKLPVVGAEYASEVIYFPKVEGYSTSAILGARQ